MAKKDIKIHDENDKTIFEYKMKQEKTEPISFGGILVKILALIVVLGLAIGMGYFLATKH